MVVFKDYKLSTLLGAPLSLNKNYRNFFSVKLQIVGVILYKAEEKFIIGN
jgi:hypothetical protein